MAATKELKGKLMSCTNWRSIVEKYIEKVGSEIGIKLLINDENTIEDEDLVIYFYNSEEYIKTNNYNTMLFGNAPILISKINGRVYLTGTAYPISFYTEKFRNNDLSWFEEIIV